MADDSKLRTARNAWRSVLLKGSEKNENSRRDSASLRQLGLRGKHSEGDNKEVG